MNSTSKPSVRSAQRGHLRPDRDHGAEVGGGRDVGVIECVLRPVVASDIALAAQPARPTCLPAVAEDVRVLVALQRLTGIERATRTDEAHRQGRLVERVVHSDLARCVAERLRLRDVGTVGKRLHVEELLDGGVVRFEVLVRDRPLLDHVLPVRVVLYEPAGILAQHHVGVDQRTATESTRRERVDPLERPHVEHPVQAFARVPQVVRHLRRCSVRTIPGGKALPRSSRQTRRPRDVNS